MGPNVKILTGQSFGSWTHGHGPMALGAWAAVARPLGRRRRGSVWWGVEGGAAAAQRPGGRAAAAHAPRAMGPCPCVQEPNRFFWHTGFLSYLFFCIPDF